eukprot:TRINITY_DN25541_c0_g1_i1.p3 TRINITY_DN25541_c0_g1~~TRINITY_DN25541_c0_g1_i1.p3  ORF type:complete len:106 (+),score=18.84 TRINITY_DN25541_c0_g1_i1:46-363(+)
MSGRQGGQHQGGGRPGGGKKNKGGGGGGKGNPGGTSGRQSGGDKGGGRDGGRVFEYKDAQKWMLDSWEEWSTKNIEVYECRGNTQPRQKPSPEVIAQLEALGRTS